MMPQDLMDRMQHERQAAQERAAADERAHKANVELFTKMFLSLGPDATKLDGTSHDQELLEARSLAASKWYRLIDLEQQVQREAAALESRPKKRPSQRADEELPDRTLEKRNAEWEDETKAKHLALAQLRDVAVAERKELEGYIVGRK